MSRTNPLSSTALNSLGDAVIITDREGLDFDSDVIEACLKLFREDGFKFEW